MCLRHLRSADSGAAIMDFMKVLDQAVREMWVLSALDFSFIRIVFSTRYFWQKNLGTI